jgi:hypothetical protein
MSIRICDFKMGKSPDKKINAIRDKICKRKIIGPTLKCLADMGKRVWDFRNLWFIVFLVGIFVTIVSSIEEYEKTYTQQNFQMHVFALTVLKEVTIVSFLAVVTSVLSQSFAGDSIRAKNLSEIEKGIRELTERFSVTSGDFHEKANDISNAIKRADRAAMAFTRLGKSLYIAGIMGELESASDEIAKEPSLDKFTTTVKNMTKTLLDFFMLSLKPILPPRCDFSTTNPNSMLNSIKLIRNQEDQPHFSYMSAVIHRYFLSESQERGLPGVHINATTFACYIQTAKSVVDSLSPWGNRFEFYTLMPDAPLRLFSFRNSTDFGEWIDFLVFYNETVKQNKVWKRFFGYSEEIIEENFLYSGDNDLNGLVLTKKGSWIPYQAQERNKSKYIKGLNRGHISEMRNMNIFHCGYTSFICPNKDYFSGSPPKGEDWQWTDIKKALLQYHCNEENFCFKQIDYLLSDFNADIMFTDNENRLSRSIQIPKDIFAVREVSNVEAPQWIFFMGREEPHSAEKQSTGRLVLTTTIDLPVLKESKAPTNIKTGKLLCDILNKLFIADNNRFSMDEFINKYGT